MILLNVKEDLHSELEVPCFRCNESYQEISDATPSAYTTSTSLQFYSLS